MGICGSKKSTATAGQQPASKTAPASAMQATTAPGTTSAEAVPTQSASTYDNTSTTTPGVQSSGSGIPQSYRGPADQSAQPSTREAPYESAATGRTGEVMPEASMAGSGMGSARGQ